jgi:glycerol-3-phosphate dehydrogenase
MGLVSQASMAQFNSENLTKYQEEHQALQNEVQLKLAKIESDFEKEVAQITQNFKLEVAKLQAEYEGNSTKSVLLTEQYKKEVGKVTNKYDLQTKDLIFKVTVEKAKIENDYYHERKKLMDKYEIYDID